MPHSDQHGQQGLFPLPQRLFSCTPSKLVTYEECPRRYRYAYLDRPTPPKGPPWAHNSLGLSVHAALRSWYGLPAAGRDAGRFAVLLRAAWVGEGYRDREQEAGCFATALEWLERYATGLDPADEPVGLERVVAAKTARLAISGRVDRIDRRGDELVIVDYKTSRAAPTVEQARGSLALAVYAYAAQRVFRRPCRLVELHHLPTGTVSAAEHTDASLERHIARAEATAADATAAAEALTDGADPDTAFAALPGRQCQWCDFRRICPHAQQPVQLEPWASIEARTVGGS